MNEAGVVFFPLPMKNTIPLYFVYYLKIWFVTLNQTPGDCFPNLVCRAL